MLRVSLRLLGPLSGDAPQQVVVRAKDSGQAMGAALYSVRKRTGGIATCEPVLDPERPELAAPLLGYVVAEVERTCPGRRLEARIASWQTALLEAAPAVGLQVTLTGYQMGLRHTPVPSGAGAGARERAESYRQTERGK